MKNVTTYLHFNGNCREAMAFYRKCLGGELTMTATPDASGRPSADPRSPVMHSQLDRDGKPLLMASDAPPGADQSVRGTNFSVSVDCTSVQELEELFRALSRGGKVNMPPSELPWGRFGMCADAFGVSWILNCARG